jgi:rare lipoprotein A
LARRDDKYTTSERKYVLSNQNTTRRRSTKTAALTAMLACVLATGLGIQPSLSRPHWSAADLRNEGELNVRSKTAGSGYGDASFGAAYARGSRAHLRRAAHHGGAQLTYFHHHGKLHLVNTDHNGGLQGIASVYHDPITANGEHMNPNAMTAAHKSLPFGSRVTVFNKRNGRSATVRINDRGPFVRGRVIDLSPGAARVLGVDGLAPVSLRVGGHRV